MELYLSIVMITMVVFLLMVLELAAKPKYSARVMGIMLLYAVLAGLLYYGIGFQIVLGNSGLAVVRTILAVCGMFVGKNEYAAIAEVAGLDQPIIAMGFWLAHLAALYATASAAITVIGAEALKKLRMLMAKSGKLAIIYGNTSELLPFGKECLGMKKMSVVFVADNPDVAYAMQIAAMGGILRTESVAVHPTKSFLKSLGIHHGKRSIYVYALNPDSNKNAQFAEELLESFSQLKMDPKNLHISLQGPEELWAEKLQVSDDHYGYGFVNAFDRSEWSARNVIRHCPTWETMSFDENGRATTDFEALIIGFGKRGQAVLKSLVMNGQFEGSHFHCMVLDRHAGAQNGFLFEEVPQIFKQYDIDFLDADARSREMYAYLNEKKDQLKYIVLCLNDEKLSEEVTSDLMRFFEKNNCNVRIVECLSDQIRSRKKMADSVKSWKLFSYQSLSTHIADQMAMQLNYQYCADTNLTPWDAWAKCDAFSRKSSRASTDFAPAMLKAAHQTEESVLEHGLLLTDQMRENLGKTEHLRWCAFHYSMGFTKMSDQEYDARKQKYLEEVKEGKPKTRIGKNMQDRTHACLIPWEALDELSARENKITGKNLDYKAMDINNVLEIPNLLKTMKEI